MKVKVSGLNVKEKLIILKVRGLVVKVKGSTGQVCYFKYMFHGTKRIVFLDLFSSNHVKLYLLFMFKVGRNLSLLNWMKSQRFYTYTLEEQRDCRTTDKMSKTC